MALARLLQASERDHPRAAPNDGHQATVTVALTIAPVNNAPVAGAPAYTLGEPDPASGTVAGALHVTDPDLDVLAYAVTTGPVSGVVVLNPSDGTFTYTPTPTARHDAAATPGVDTDSFIVSVDDGYGGVVTVPVSVPISPANSPPSLSVTVGDPNEATGEVTISITVDDPDLDPIVYQVTSDPAYGTLPRPPAVSSTPRPRRPGKPPHSPPAWTPIVSR